MRTECAEGTPLCETHSSAAPQLAVGPAPRNP